MRSDAIVDLTDCTEFRQALQARPPRVVHGTAALLAGLLGAGLLWAALARADLVVPAAGRVRPVSTPTRVFNPGGREALAARLGCQVAEVSFREGDEVRRGEVLLRLDVARLDAEIARRKRTVQAGEEELAKIARLESLASAQHQAARAKAEAELAQALEEVRQARKRQASDARLVQVELESARDEEARMRRLLASRAAAPAEMVKATARLREAQEKLDRARLPVEEGKVEVVRRALALAEKDHAVRREELSLKRAARQGEVDAARLELAELGRERGRAVVRAPRDGVVTAGDLKAGDLLEPGKAVAEIAPNGGFRFEAMVTSEDVAHLRVGMPARVKLDAYDYQRHGVLAGTVCYIAPDSVIPEGRAAAFYLVRIDLDGDEIGEAGLRGCVKLGMAGQAEIVTAQESLLALLVKKVRQTIRLG